MKRHIMILLALLWIAMIGIAPCGTLISATGETMENNDLSFMDADVTMISVTVDGKAMEVTMYEECYVKYPTSIATTPSKDGIDQKLSIYVPENATAESPVLLMVNNSAWTLNGYAIRTMVTDGKKYNSTGNNIIGAALSRGVVIVSYGCRSRDDNIDENGKRYSHAPATITDTKAVIRYLRHISRDLPAGDPEKIIITGTSGGGALSTIVAASGDSSDYYESLYAIGAAGIAKEEEGTYVSSVSDSVFAVVAYCPIDDLREADAAYEFTYHDVRKRLVHEGLDIFQDRFSDTYTVEWMLTASEALKKQYADYLSTLNLLTEDGELLTVENLSDKTRQLLNQGFRNAYKTIGLEQMLMDLTGEGKYSGTNTAENYNSTSTDWEDFFSYDEEGVPFLADAEALQQYFYFVARNQGIKGACAFSNKGIGSSNKNEDTLYGTESVLYSPFEFYSWNNDLTEDNGVGADDTGLSWDEYLQTPEGQVLSAQLKMSSSIPYLLDSENNTTARYWYVRYGARDRDTSFDLQTVLYYAMVNNSTIVEPDFRFVWLQPHAGNYDVQEAFSWIDSLTGGC